MLLTRGICALLLVLPAFCQRRAAPPPAKAGATSDTHITVNGGDTFALPRVAGEWFSTPSDAHVAVVLTSAPGTPAARLDLSLDGRSTTQTITAQNNSDLGGAHVGFFWTSPNVAARPRGGDAITVQVTHLDDRDFEARLFGSADGTKLGGAIHLHRDTMPSAVLTGTYGECDNVVHDKYALAESRSASDCEMKFDRMVREALAQALRPAAQFLQGREWTVVKQSEVKPIDDMARHSEQKPYRVENTHLGAFIYEFQLGAAALSRYQQRFTELTQRAGEELKSGGRPGPSYRQALDFGYEMQGAARLRISPSINSPGLSIISFRGGHASLQVPGAAYAISVSHAQAATGGGAGASRDESFILFGNWSPPAVQPQSEGSEQINFKPALNNAAPLTVQNIVIRIQANRANAEQAAAHIDVAELNRLLQRR
jgi:hypothetical protein